ncbi:459_t:CDS:2 [Racocetra fulgida]|uniref:459_t:CDS:1 n=1 Tax=Racocetra fulgida TaxID=60492 RepID=A0A9N8ZLQ9_9GLOM|nr:459_t:CDS:2 [Racocetra fulgida]
MSTSNRDSEPVVSNDASAQLDMVQAEVVARLARKSKAQMGPEGSIGESEPFEKGKNASAKFPDLFGRQAAFGSNFAHIKTLNKKAPSWNADLDALMLEDVKRALLNKALLSGDSAYIRLARQVVLERAYVVRVADEDGNKREIARVAVQHFTKSKKLRSAYHFRSKQSQTQAPIFHLTSVPVLQFAQMQPYVHQTGFYQQFLNQLMVLQGQFGGLVTVSQTVQTSPQFLQGVDQNLQHVSSNVGLPSPIRQQSYPSMSS